MICTLNDDFIEYLFKYDNKVPYNKNGTRPYVGVLFDLGGIHYFAPLSSPKPKHLTMKDEALDYIKIDKGLLGIINLNNMIPVPDGQYRIFDIDNEPNKNYKTLLKNQFIFFNNNSANIINKAKKLHNLYAKNHLHQNIKSRCCEFLELEKKCQEFICGESK